MKKVLLLVGVCASLLANQSFGAQPLEGVYKQVYDQFYASFSQEGQEKQALEQSKIQERLAERLLAANSTRLSMAELEEFFKKCKPYSREFWQELLTFQGIDQQDLGELCQAIEATKNSVTASKNLRQAHLALREATDEQKAEKRALFEQAHEQYEGQMANCQLLLLMSVASCSDYLLEPMRVLSNQCKQEFDLAWQPIMMANAYGERWLDEMAVAKAEYLTKGMLVSMMLAQLVSRALADINPDDTNAGQDSDVVMQTCDLILEVLKKQ